jgi:hypothetical protein
MSVGNSSQRFHHTHEHLKHADRPAENGGGIACKKAEIILPLTFDGIDRELIDIPHIDSCFEQSQKTCWRYRIVSRSLTPDNTTTLATSNRKLSPAAMALNKMSSSKSCLSACSFHGRSCSILGPCSRRISLALRARICVEIAISVHQERLHDVMRSLMR